MSGRVRDDAAARWWRGSGGAMGGVDPVVSRTMKGDGGNWLWVGGGNPVVSRCSTTGYRPAPLAGVRFHLVWFPAVSLVPSSTSGSYEGCQAAGSVSDSGGEGRRFPGGVCRFPRGSLARAVFLYFLTTPKQRLLPGACFARGFFASFFRCASGRGMVSLSAKQPCTFRASSSYPYADSQSGYIMGYPSPIEAGASGSI